MFAIQQDKNDSKISVLYIIDIKNIDEKSS